MKKKNTKEKQSLLGKHSAWKDREAGYQEEWRQANGTGERTIVMRHTQKAVNARDNDKKGCCVS